MITVSDKRKILKIDLRLQEPKLSRSGRNMVIASTQKASFQGV
jgi:hypothetical protein